MSPPPWWELLTDDFHAKRHPPDLAPGHRFTVCGCAALDRVLRTGLFTALSAAAAPTVWTPARFERDVRWLRHHEALARRGDVDIAFPRPVSNVDIEVLPSGSGPKGIPSRLLCFHSPFRPSQPDLAESYGRLQRNAHAYAQHWFHPGGSRPTLIMIHGYCLDSYWLNARWFCMRWFYEHGYDIVLYTMPFHGLRSERWDPWSGYRVFAHGWAHANEAIAQAVHDLRIFMDFLRAGGVPSIGVSGLSLGGYVAALTASVDGQLAFCIPNAPPVSPVDVYLEWSPRASWIVALLRHHGLSVSRMRGLCAVHNPLTYAPRVDAERLLLIGGAGDRFASPKQLQLLAQHWSGASLHWFPGNHLVHVGQGEYLRKMKRFMDRCA